MECDTIKLNTYLNRGLFRMCRMQKKCIQINISMEFRSHMHNSMQLLFTNAIYRAAVATVK